MFENVPIDKKSIKKVIGDFYQNPKIIRQIWNMV